MKARLIRFMAGGALVCGLLAGCGSDSTSSFDTGGGTSIGNPTGTAPTGGGFTVREELPAARDGHVVDALELEAYDAQGNRTAQSVVPFKELMSFPSLPAGTTTVQLDYLRHGGVPIYRATIPVQASQQHLDNPRESAIDARSNWKIEAQEDGGFKLKLTANEGTKTISDPNFRLKGVCYGPCPINVQGDGAPQVNDFFFDVIKKGSDVVFYNWYALWGTGSLGDGFYAREDLNRIRDLNCNSIRVYGMTSRQQNNRFDNPDQPEFPEPTSKPFLTHHDFLAKCWNAGENPIYVIVDIPMPSDCFYQGLQGNTAKIKFYDYVFRETIKDLKDEPAVIGFTIQNEKNDPADAYPGTGPAGQMLADRPETARVTERGKFYWAKVKEYSDYAKQTAPDKITGMCLNDFREIAQYAGSQPTDGPTYLQQCANLEWIGINVYQTVNYNDQYQKGWGAVPKDKGRKPIIFSELGFPATYHPNNVAQEPLAESAESRTNTAKAVERMLPQAYLNSISLGACYFEFTDEWWKNVHDKKIVYNINGDRFEAPNSDKWVGGERNDGFPNKWQDEEGFGLFSIKRYQGLKNEDPVIVKVNGIDIGPDRRVDQLTERTEITKVIKEIFSNDAIIFPNGK